MKNSLQNHALLLFGTVLFSILLTQNIEG